MTRVSVLIAEDEPIARQSLRELAEGVDWIELVGEVGDGLAAVEAIDRLRPGLVFLDIEMPGLDGLQVLEHVTHDPAVVFTTAYDRYAVAAFELEAVDYLLKPFGKDRFIAAAERARRSLASGGIPRATERVRDAMQQRGPLERLFVRDRGRIIPIAVTDIERLEAEDDYVALLVGGRRYLVYLSLAEFEQRLNPARFLRIHRSHIVNLDHVVSLTPYDSMRLEVQLRGGSRIVASRARSKELRKLTI